MNNSTNAQDVINARAKLEELKKDYMRDLEAYVKSTTNPSDRIDLVLQCQQSANRYFNYAEEFVGNSDLLGAHASALWAQGFAEDCCEILSSYPDYFKFLNKAFSVIRSPMGVTTLRPGPTAFANMQRMVAKYLTAKVSKGLQRSFNDLGLPVYGFENEARNFMSDNLRIWLSFIFGVLFVSAILAIAVLKPNPTTTQFTIFRSVFALAGGGVAAVIPGFIEVKLGNWLRAGGAIAVFIVLYFFSPKLTSTSGEPPSQTFPSAIKQRSNLSDCSNIVSNGDTSINCPSVKEPGDAKTSKIPTPSH